MPFLKHLCYGCWYYNTCNYLPQYVQYAHYGYSFVNIFQKHVRNIYVRLKMSSSWWMNPCSIWWKRWLKLLLSCWLLQYCLYCRQLNIHEIFCHITTSPSLVLDRAVHIPVNSSIFIPHAVISYRIGVGVASDESELLAERRHSIPRAGQGSAIPVNSKSGNVGNRSF